MEGIRASQIFSIKSDAEFCEIALRIFRYQAEHNSVYAEFLRLMNLDPSAVDCIEDIPFAPISFFKSQNMLCGDVEPQIVFSSSGTTGMIQSRHLVRDTSIYTESFRSGFEYFYGDIADYTLLALLPSYQEREGSSLIFMVDDLISEAKSESGYFLYNHEELHRTLISLKERKQRTLLIGVTYALLDFVEAYSIAFPDLIVMETGGMKGQRKEMIREDLHRQLCLGFGVSSIHSEYGMTELLSQAYSKGNGKFECPPWMKIKIRDTNDPLTYLETGRTGGVNVIDLANLHSCSFLATQDLGKLHPDGTFEVLGRFDNSDIRGCNLLVQ